MKAVVIERPGSIAYRDVDAPEPGDSDVLVRSHAAGVCRTDLEIRDGLVPRSWVRYPVVPGHEWSGVVEATGAAVDDLAPGDPVVCEGMIPCHRCDRCRRGDTNLCLNYDQVGFTRPGGYGELVVVPRHTVHRLPPEVPLDRAVLVEPAACVYRALLRAAPVPGERAGVVGIGTLGSLALCLLGLFSPAELVAFGVRREELELAERFGATRAVLDGTAEARGLDLVVETAGAPAAIRTALDAVRDGGRVVLLGLAGSDARLELPADELAVRDVTVIGSLSYTTAAWAGVLELLAGGRIELDPIITHRFPIAAYDEAMHLLGHRKGVVAKILLCH